MFHSISFFQRPGRVTIQLKKVETSPGAVEKAVEKVVEKAVLEVEEVVLEVVWEVEVVMVKVML